MAKAKAACRCKKAECEECPEWIFTFADLVMLMMGFFVILWVLKPPAGTPKTAEAETRWKEVVGKIREAFGHLPDPDSRDPIDMRLLVGNLDHLEPPLKGPGSGAESQEPQQSPRGSDPLVMNVRPGQHVTVGGRLSFAPGDATLTPEIKTVLDEVVKLIRGYRNIFQVKGHTALDDFADGASPQQLMDLSLRRAQGCSDYLIAHGVSPDTVRVQGCSTFEPIVQRTYTPDAQASNRRVEIEATDQLVRERQDNSSNSTGATTPVEKPEKSEKSPPAHKSAHE